MSYKLNLPLLMLFKGVPADWRGPEHLRRQIGLRKVYAWAQPVIAGNELRNILTAALSEDPPPSVAEVARRLKFRHTQTLCSREPELCRQIATRRRNSDRARHDTARIYGRSERRRLENVLQHHLAGENPPSLYDIARQLGYKSSGAIRERFPALCRAIAAKRKQRFLQKREEIRCAIEEARQKSPPPSLKEIARRFGLTTESSLSTAYPELCASHKQWRQDWLAEHRLQLQSSIRQWVEAAPAPTLSSVCRHFHISRAYFLLHFPAENITVVQRSMERRRLAREDRGAIMRKKVFEIVRELREKEIYPSLPRVSRAIPPGLARYWPLLRPVIDEAILQFGAVTRPRNELGRFI